MIGPFGGCYMLRSNYFSKVPDNYLVDDFYIAMEVFRKGGLAINDLSAICTESNSSDILEEFKRKSRISAGNFQNLLTFKNLLWPPFSKLAFNFISHKVLRWLGPLFIATFTILGLILGLSGKIDAHICSYPWPCDVGIARSRARVVDLHCHCKLRRRAAC